MSYYYLTPDRKPCGPLPLEELCAKAEGGLLTPAAMVAKEGDAMWRPLQVVAAEQGIELKVKVSPGVCPTCEQPLSLLPDGTLPLSCPHCGRAFRPIEGRENNLWYNFTLALRQYAKFTGRATRQEYWSYVLFALLTSLVPFFLLFAGGCAILIAAGDSDEPGEAGFVLLMVAYYVNYALSLFYLLPSYAIWVRRLHDVGWSGKWVLAGFFAFVVAMLCVLGGAFLSVMMEDGLTLALAVVAGLLYLFGIVVLIITCVLCFFDSQRGPNKYGPSRKYPLG